MAWMEETSDNTMRRYAPGTNIVTEIECHSCMKGECTNCGRSTEKEHYRMTVDRIHSSRYHANTNICTKLKFCNEIKSNTHPKYFERMMDLIANFHSSRDHS